MQWEGPNKLAHLLSLIVSICSKAWKIWRKILNTLEITTRVCYSLQAEISVHLSKTLYTKLIR